jgi:flagellar hook-associated protein 1 FlgK
MSGSVMNIGLTALNAAQAGLVTTGHNISNASTAGYNRQRVDSAPQVPQLSGGGFFGRGVSVENVRRSYSAVLDRQTQLAQTQVSFYDTYATQVNQIGNLVADPASGLSPAMQEFFRAVQDVAASPGTTTSRQALLSTSGALVSRFGALDQRMTDLRTGVNVELAGTVDRADVAFLPQLARAVGAARRGARAVCAPRRSPPPPRPARSLRSARTSVTGA